MTMDDPRPSPSGPAATSPDPAPNDRGFTIPALLPSRKRRVVVIGNCQANTVTTLYRTFVACRTGEILTHVASYEDLTQADIIAIEQADLIVEQLFDLKPQADMTGVAPGMPRLFIPMVTAGFLWPFAGQPHPKNTTRPFLPSGPYGGQAADSYLNRMILAGVNPEEAVETYMQLDVRARTNLDRMYELIMDRQRSRDEASGYRIADLIEQHFRTEQIFLSPYHPNTRLAVALATQFFQQMGAQPADIERMQNRTRRTPFPKEELPLHPSVCKHFGLDFITPDRRYRFMNEGSFTFREYALRYMRYEWNEVLEEGRSLVHTRDLDAAHDKLVAGLVRSPASAAGHHALSIVLAHQNRREEALAESRRAVQIEPDSAPYRAQCGMLLRQQGRLQEAEVELRAAVATEPVDPHYLILLAHLLRQRGEIEECCALARETIAADPYSARLHEELSTFLEANGDLAGAIAAQQQAMAISGDHASGLPRFAHLLGRVERMPEAEQVVRAAIARGPQTTRPRITLSDILLRQGKSLEALNEALMAAVIDPDSAEAYSHIGHILHQSRDPAAETALLRAARLDPRNPHFRHQLSDVFNAAGRLPEAIEAATQATELDPRNPRRFAHLSRLYLRADDVAGAEAAQRQAVSVAPNDTVLRVGLSDLLARLGRREEALDEARTAVGQQPDSAHTLGHLAHIMQFTGNLEQSENIYRRALGIAPDNHHLREQLSSIQSRRAQAAGA
jgi:tetratricopeptide (TPR) repeat protein